MTIKKIINTFKSLKFCHHDKSGNPVTPYEMLENNTLAYANIDRNDIYELFNFQPKNILDIGCHTGDVGAGLKEKYGSHLNIWGVELNLKAAEIAKLKLDKISTTPIEDISNEEKSNLNLIDTIIMLDVLEHMYNPWKTLNFLSKHVNEKCQFIISLPNIMHLDVVTDLLNGFWHYKKAGTLDITHIRFFTYFEMKSMFEESGLKITKEHFIIDQKCKNIYKNRYNNFPLWLKLENAKIRVHSQFHWQQLVAKQIYFSLVVNNDQNITKHSIHPQTYTYGG